MAYESVWNKIKPRGIKVSQTESGSIQKILPQSSRPVNIPKDVARKAKLPGIRISKTNKRYWETRANRSDLPGKRI